MQTANDLVVKRLEKKDLIFFQKLIALFREVFEMKQPIHVEGSYLTQLLENPDFIVYAIFFKNEIVGGLTAYELSSYYAESAEVFIYDIAIKPAFQRKGLGRQLLLSLKEYCAQKNIKIMFVEANEEDEHAVDFYHSTGGKAEKVIHFNYYLDQ
jgi:aminoglycoside 3-N-acetyltransferase I